MPDSVKMLIAERNGVDLYFHEELDFLPENMPITLAGFTADNVKDAIQEASAGGGGGTFGQNYIYSESESISSTSSSSYQRKVLLTTPSVSAGDYRIGWSFEGTHTNDLTEFEFRVRLDDSTTLNGDCRLTADDASLRGEYIAACGFKQVTLTAGVHEFDIDYRELGSDTSRIRRARLEFWRVS